MTHFIKIGLLATTILGAAALSLAAETVVVPLNTQTDTVVGTTTNGDLVVKSTTYAIVPMPMTEAEIAAVNSDVVAGDNTVLSPYVGWQVNSSDNIEVGKITFSVQDVDGKISSFNMVMADGRHMRINNGIAEMGTKAIRLRISQTEVMASAIAHFSAIEVK